VDAALAATVHSARPKVARLCRANRVVGSRVIRLSLKSTVCGSVFVGAVVSRIAATGKGDQGVVAKRCEEGINRGPRRTTHA
jgi:hypothetical protein